MTAASPARHRARSSRWDHRVHFVNPNADEILGHTTYPDLASLPEVPDFVDVFRKGSDIPFSHRGRPGHLR